jgi:predicted phosphohydrolase
MKLRILSDLHIEFADFTPPPTDADVTVLAGDIGVGMAALDWTHLNFPEMPVVYVLGNHEYYRHDLALLGQMKKAALSNVHILENDCVVLEGVRFLGATLWTDFALHGLAEQSFAN